jgi:plasmid maintenance system killer protein
MVILFRNTKLEKELSEERRLIKKHGARRAGLIKRRLTEMAAAEVLGHLRYLPQMRCHELTGNLKGKLSVDLDHPYRLIFEAANEPQPKKPDGGLDWAKVTEIRILGIEDTHE